MAKVKLGADTPRPQPPRLTAWQVQVDFPDDGLYVIVRNDPLVNRITFASIHSQKDGCVACPKDEDQAKLDLPVSLPDRKEAVNAAFRVLKSYRAAALAGPKVNPEVAALMLRLRESGAANLRKFGYPKASAATVTTDAVYRQFFLRMLEEAKADSKTAAAREAIDRLAKECEK